MLSFVLMLPDLVKTELEKSFLEKEFWFVENALSFVEKELMREPPLMFDVECGTNEPAVDGGGPAGVVDKLLQRLRERSLSGVSGGLDS
jgi:hypothetical protein